MKNISSNIAVSIIVALFLLSLSEISARDSLTRINAGVKTESESLYILREYNGLVALFENGKNTPREVYDVLVSDLPETDIAALKAGICISSDEQLRQVIEDYSG